MTTINFKIPLASSEYYLECGRRHPRKGKFKVVHNRPTCNTSNSKLNGSSSWPSFNLCPATPHQFCIIQILPNQPCRTNSSTTCNPHLKTDALFSSQSTKLSFSPNVLLNKKSTYDIFRSETGQNTFLIERNDRTFSGKKISPEHASCMQQ